MISLSLQGLKDAVEVFRDNLVPWRKENARRIANLDNTLKQAQIHKINAETLTEKAKQEREQAGKDIDAANVKKLEAEANFLNAQAEKYLAEAEREKAAIRQAQIELVLKIVEQYAPPDLGNTQKIEYVIQLLPVVDKLLTSDIEIVDS